MPDIDLGAVDRGSGQLRGYLACPDGAGPWPGVVVLHEAWGLNDVVRRQADRLAAAGYLALAPDLFSDGGAARCVASTMLALVSGRGKPFADIAAARGWLLAEPRCTGRVGVIGFCLGGGFALATADSGFDVASVNYGQLPRHLDRALQDACPVVASYGAKDLGARRTVRRLEEGLAQRGVAHDVKLYPAAGHSFLNDGPAGPAVLQPLLRVANLGPEPESARDAWQRIEAFFASHLQT